MSAECNISRLPQDIFALEVGSYLPARTLQGLRSLNDYQEIVFRKAVRNDPLETLNNAIADDNLELFKVIVEEVGFEPLLELMASELPDPSKANIALYLSRGIPISDRYRALVWIRQNIERYNAYNIFQHLVRTQPNFLDNLRHLAKSLAKLALVDSDILRYVYDNIQTGSSNPDLNLAVLVAMVETFGSIPRQLYDSIMDSFPDVDGNWKEFLDPDEGQVFSKLVALVRYVE